MHMDLEVHNRNQRPGRASRIASVTLVLFAALLTIATASGHDFAVDDWLLLALRRAGDLRTPIGPHWLVNLFENITSLGSSAVTALVTTRPLGASLGDYLSQHSEYGGIGFGTVYTSLLFLGAIIITVIYMTAHYEPEVSPDVEHRHI